MSKVTRLTALLPPEVLEEYAQNLLKMSRAPESRELADLLHELGVGRPPEPGEPPAPVYARLAVKILESGRARSVVMRILGK